MAETRGLERLSASDLYVLLWDDFGWSGNIGVLAVLDGTGLLDPDGGVRIEAVRRQLEPRLHLVPRFRQRLYRPGLGLGWPLWVDSASFDLADHVRVFPLAAPGGREELLQACEQLAQRRLDPSRPLWEAWLLPGMPERRVGLFLRAHHAMVDGMAGVAAFAALLDSVADAITPAVPPWTPMPIPTTGELLHDNLRRRLQGLDRVWSSLAHPRSTLRQARRASPAWREFLAERRAPRTSLNHPIGAERRLALVGSRLEVVKQVAHAHHAKVNDVVLAAVAGGLRELLRHRGEPVEQLTLRALVPISLHREQAGQARGNQDGWMVVPLALGEPDPARRLDLIAAETAARKHKAHPQTGAGIFRFALAQRAFLRLFARQRLVNITVTNVAGPPVPLYLSGSRLQELFPVVSLAANLRLAVAVLSYAGQLNLTAVADRDGFGDVEVFAKGAQSTLDDLARSVLAPTSWSTGCESATATAVKPLSAVAGD
jgi:diacylglycerol O-acyltransferase / wax synthase